MDKLRKALGLRKVANKKNKLPRFSFWILLFQLNLPDPPTVVVEMRNPQEFEDDSISLVNVGSVEKPSIEELLTM